MRSGKATYAGPTDGHPKGYLIPKTATAQALGDNLGINQINNLIYRAGGVIQANGRDQSHDTIRRSPVSGLTECPQCAKMMKSDAKVCGFCSYDFVNNRPAPTSKNSLLGCIAIIALVILTMLILAGIKSIVSEGPPEQQVVTQ